MKMTIIMISLFILSQYSKTDAQTVLVINLFRHGARLPYVKTIFSNTSEQSPVIDNSDLTAIGMRQHYLLGKAIREKYGNFLDPIYNYRNVEVISSNRKRTLVSAQSQLQGIYDLGSGFSIDNDNKDFYNPPIKDFDIPFPKNERKNAIPKRPTFIPILNPDTQKNTLFLPLSECPVLIKNIQRDKDFELEKNKDVFQHLYDNLIKHDFYPFMYSDKDYFTIPSAFLACDAAISNYFYDPEVQYDEVLLDECNYITEYLLFINYRIQNNRSTSNTPLSKIIKDYIDKKTQDQLKDLQLLLLSSHDNTLISFLSIFYPENDQCILQEYQKKYIEKEDIGESKCLVDQLGYSSNIIFEIFKDTDTQQHYISLQLNNKDLKVFKKDEPSSVITVKEFLQILNKENDLNFDENCGNSKTIIETSNKYLVLWIISLFLIFILIGAFYYLKHKEKTKEDESMSIDQQRLIL